MYTKREFIVALETLGLECKRRGDEQVAKDFLVECAIRCGSRYSIMVRNVLWLGAGSRFETNRLLAMLNGCDQEAQTNGI